MRSYLPLREVGPHAVLGHILCHDSDDDLRLRLVPVVSAGEAKGNTDCSAAVHLLQGQIGHGNWSESPYVKLGESYQARGLT